MPSKSTGKTITRLKINKKNVVLYFNKERCEISHDAFTTMYLFVGKTLSSKEIKELKDFSLVSKLYKYALSLLKRSRYSEWKIREKLYAKDANKYSVDKVIEKLKTSGILDDKGLVEELVDYSNDKNIGKNKILRDLSNKGIFEEELNKISFPIKKEKEKALNQLPKLEKKYNSYSYEKKKQHIYSSLLSLGFDSGVALEAMNYISPKNNKDESNKIKKDFMKIKQRLSKKYDGQMLFTKVTASLRNKGYSYKDIKKILEDDNHDDWGIC